MTTPDDWPDPLARWLHSQRVGCDFEPYSPVDVGLGYYHNGDHEADAQTLRIALRWSAAGVPPIPDDKVSPV